MKKNVNIDSIPSLSARELLYFYDDLLGTGDLTLPFSKDHKFYIDKVISEMRNKEHPFIAWPSVQKLKSKTGFKKTRFYAVRKFLTTEIKVFKIINYRDGTTCKHVLTEWLREQVTMGFQRRRDKFFDKKLKSCGTVIEDIYSTDDYYVDEVYDPIASSEDIEKVRVKCSKFNKQVRRANPNINNNILNIKNNYEPQFFSEPEKKKSTEQKYTDQTLDNLKPICDNAKKCTNILDIGLELNMHIMTQVVDMLGNIDLERSASNRIYRNASDKSLNNFRKNLQGKNEKESKTRSRAVESSVVYAEDGVTQEEEKLPLNFKLTLETHAYARQAGLTEEQIPIAALTFCTWIASRIQAGMKGTSRNWQKSFRSWLPSYLKILNKAKSDNLQLIKSYIQPKNYQEYSRSIPDSHSSWSVINGNPSCGKNDGSITKEMAMKSWREQRLALKRQGY